MDAFALGGEGWKDPSVIAVIMDAGANVEARDKYGWTPLHFAKAPSVIAALVDAGANLEARTEEGWTPLHVAAQFSKITSQVEALLDAGADPKAKASNSDMLPWDFIKENVDLEGTVVYWRLNDARFK